MASFSRYLHWNDLLSAFFFGFKKIGGRTHLKSPLALGGIEGTARLLPKTTPFLQIPFAFRPRLLTRQDPRPHWTPPALIIITYPFYYIHLWSYNEVSTYQKPILVQYEKQQKKDNTKNKLNPIVYYVLPIHNSLAPCAVSDWFGPRLQTAYNTHPSYSSMLPDVVIVGDELARQNVIRCD